MSDKYGAGHDGQYCYPGSVVLVNKLGITGTDALEAVEIELTQMRIEQYEPDFDDISLSALQSIHFNLFKDLYGWAGELRRVDISKGGTRFANVNQIQPEAEMLFLQLAQKTISPACPVHNSLPAWRTITVS